MASETDTSSPGHSDPSTASAAAARLGSLLAGIRDDLRECLDSAKALADDNGILFSLSADRIAAAMLYLHDVGLPHDAARLRRGYQECQHLMVQQMLALTLGANLPPDGLTKEEYRDVLTAKFGPLPTRTLDDLRVMLTGRAAQLLQHVEELIVTVGAMHAAGGPSPQVALTPEEKTILEVLANEGPMTVTQEDLAEQTRLSDKTVRKYVGELRGCGFVNQPRGPKKGFAITPAGLAAIGHK